MQWFATASGQGKSSLEQQSVGLDPLWPLVIGRTVLDVGCAEGLIARRCLDIGAASVHGVELREQAVWHTRALQVPCDNADADDYMPKQAYDIVLMLAILHKLKKPADVFRRMLASCNITAVVRLPNGSWPLLVDSRSGSVPIDLEQVASNEGFRLVQVTHGPVCDKGPQWTGYFTRS